MLFLKDRGSKKKCIEQTRGKKIYKKWSREREKMID